MLNGNANKVLNLVAEIKYPLNGLNVAVEGTVMEHVTVTPTKSEQEVAPEAGKAFSLVLVEPIPDKYQDVSGVTAGEDHVLEGFQVVDSSGELREGSIPIRSEADLTASGATVSVPAGFYESAVSKDVATAPQATPSIYVDSAGLITASATQSAGYVSSGTQSATEQLATQGAQTFTPGTTDQKIPSGQYLTGTQTIKGDSNLKAENIKKGVSIFEVAGSHECEEGFTLPPIDEAVLGTASDLVKGKELIGADGKIVTGTMPKRTADDLTASGLTVSVPAGYYETDAYKSVEVPDTGDSDLTLVTANVTSTKGTQEVTPNAGEAFSKVIVNPIPDKYQDVSGVTARPEQVLDGAYFVDSTGQRKEGNIPIRSEADLTATNRAVTVPAGFYETAVTKEVDLNIAEGAGILFGNEDVKLVRTDSKLLATAVMASEHLLPAGATIEFQMANSRFGNAKKTDVVYGATFTSENGLNIPGTKPVDQGNNTVAEGTVEADSLAQLHYWEKSAVTEDITEETVSDYQLWYKSSYGTQSVTYGFSQYAEEIDIIDGALVLVNPQSRDGVANSDYDTVLPGKYIQSGTTFYRVPADAVISTYQTTGATRITADRVFKLTLVSVGGRSIVVSDDSSMFPTNGELEGYTYVYKGTLNALAKDAVIQALTVTENGTYTPPDGVDGYGPVTVAVAVSSGGVELPDIAEEDLGTSADLLMNKQLIGPDGKVVTGKMANAGSFNKTIDGINSSMIFGSSGYYSGVTVTFDDSAIVALLDSL